MIMRIEQLVATAPAWTDETWASRLDKAASVLFVHGYINQTQRSKITQTLEKQFKEAIVSGKIVERA